MTAEEACRFICCALYHCFENCKPGTLGKPRGLQKKKFEAAVSLYYATNRPVFTWIRLTSVHGLWAVCCALNLPVRFPWMAWKPVVHRDGFQIDWKEKKHICIYRNCSENIIAWDICVSDFNEYEEIFQHRSDLVVQLPILEVRGRSSFGRAQTSAVKEASSAFREPKFSCKFKGTDAYFLFLICQLLSSGFIHIFHLFL